MRATFDPRRLDRRAPGVEDLGVELDPVHRALDRLDQNPDLEQVAEGYADRIVPGGE